MSATRTAFRDPAPAITGDVRAMLETLGLNSLGGVQDRALLLVVQLRRSTTDQEAEGRRVGLPFGPNPLTCPVRALRAWLDQAGIVEGPIFRPVDRHGNVGKRRLTDQSVALVVKRCARAAGLDPRQYAGHSLRAGLATAAAQADVPERAIMAQTGHPSLPMVHRYIRDGSLFRTNAAAAIGL